MTRSETWFTLFIIVTNTLIQLALSKKSMKLFMVAWGRDFVSACMFISMGMYWQVYIIAWQFVLTILGYFCWKYENKHGEKINQLQLIQKQWQRFSHTIAKSVKQKQSKT